MAYLNNPPLEGAKWISNGWKCRRGAAWTCSHLHELFRASVWKLWWRLIISWWGLPSTTCLSSLTVLSTHYSQQWKLLDRIWLSTFWVRFYKMSWIKQRRLNMILNLLPKRASGAILKPLSLKTCDHASVCYYCSVLCKYVENIRNNVWKTRGGYF